jgi:hypothetical protein
VGAVLWRDRDRLQGRGNRAELTRSRNALSEPEAKKKDFKVRANVPIKRPQRDLYCANRTSGPSVSEITTTVQISVSACIFWISMNSNPNLAALTDRNF